MKKNTRLPAVPLITHDPYFSIWHTGDIPTSEETVHWSGVQKAMRGFLIIDGVRRRFLGRNGRQAMKMTECEVTPLSTRYTLEALGVRLKMAFTSPLLPDDLDLMSTPVTFLDFDVDFTDGRPHQVQLVLNITADLCHSGEVEQEVRQDFFSDGGLHYGYMGNMRQTPLAGCGDHLTCDWGHVFLASEDTIDHNPDTVEVMLRYTKTADAPFRARVLIGYDDTASIQYFGRLLPAYYARGGKTIVQALAEFHRRHDEILERCRAFDEGLVQEAEAKGGEDYALIATAAYRQTVAGHKLVEGPEGELLFISKENDSNGCAATVDISYPSMPLFLLYAPELVRAMCRPVLKFANMPVWKYDFAPHDVGRYPILSGQHYGAYLRAKHQRTGSSIAPYYLYPASAELYRDDMQMPVEESANMLLLLAASGCADGNFSLAAEHLPLLRRWCGYLLEHGEDPGNQLCTDDFAGHLARNVNLSAKAFCAVAGFAEILKGLGRQAESEDYLAKARAMAQRWLLRADMGGYTSLTFDKQGWSIKYNLVWDKLFGWGLLPEEFYRREIGSYLGRMNEYGLPLDSRSSCGKTDWILWVAAMADDTQLAAFIAPVAKFLRETPSRVPFSDYYDTETGTYERMIARTVQGGLYMPLLMDRWKNRRTQL